MNPSRSLGPGLVSGELHEIWVYVVAPIAGATLGAVAYQLIRGAPASHRRDENASPPGAIVPSTEEA
jgi:Major intrinsic protein